MTDLTSHKARVDSARDLAELSRIDADASAARKVEGWTDAAWADFDTYRQAKAIDLVQHSAARMP